MTPVQRLVNIYKANSEFNNQTSSKALLYLESAKKNNLKSDGNSAFKSFEQVLKERIKKQD